MIISEIKDKAEAAKIRGDYFANLMKFCEGYLANEEKAHTDKIKTDSKTSTAMKAIIARSRELIVEDALIVLTHNLDGKDTWNNKPEKP
jgi:hypothetical protein